MKRGVPTAVLVIAWVAALGLTVVAVATMTPAGDGFTRGLNRTLTLLGGLALVALISLLAARSARTRTGGLARAARALPWATAAGCVAALAVRLAVIALR